MPTDDGFGSYDMQRVAPARPGTSQERPEKPIKTIQSRFGPFPLQDGDLLAKREDSTAISVQLWKKTRAAAIRDRRRGITR